MKIYKILSTVLAIAAFVGCAKEQIINSNPGVQISSSYISFTKDGGSQSITLKADADWTIDTAGTSKWFTVDPIKGTANNEAKVSFTAKANASGAIDATVTVKFTDGKSQIITLAQAGSEAAPATVKEVMDGVDGATFKVTATVVRIKDKHYGNIYLNDGTSPDKDLYLYGVLDKKGNKMEKATPYDVLDPKTSPNAWNISVGDVITVLGARKTYGDEIEFENAEILDIQYSLVDVSPLKLTVSKEASDTAVVVKYKGNDLKVKPEVDWIKIGDIQVGTDSTIVSLHVAANEGGPRSGLVKIMSSIPGQDSSKEVTVTQEGSTTPINEVVVGQPCFVSGTITGFCAAGFIITDETGSILYYQSKFANPNNYVVGDEVEVTCSEATTFNGALEVEPKNITKEVKVGHKDVTYPAPVLMGRAAVEEYLANCDGVTAPCKYVKVSGKVSISGNYYNIIFGDSEKQGSFYQPTDEQKALVENDKMYELTGYLIGYSKSSGVVKFANFLVMDAKELNPTKTFAEIIAAGAGDYSCEATVVAVGSNQVALTDGTEYMFMYNKAKNAVVGSKVLLNGPVTQYNGCWEWNDPAFYVSAKDVPVVHPTAVNMTATEFDAYKSAPGVKYYKVVGTKGASGYDVTGDGFVINPYSNATINPGSVTLYGYSIGIKSNKMNFVVASVEQ